MTSVELSQDLGRFGRESGGWFIYVPQIYHLGRKVQQRKRSPGLEFHISRLSSELQTAGMVSSSFSACLGSPAVTAPDLEVGVFLWVIEPVSDTQSKKSKDSGGTFAELEEKYIFSPFY